MSWPTPEAHRDQIVREIAEEIGEKYLNGQKEHGGVLYRKPGNLDNAIQEAHDLEVYLHTERYHKRAITKLLGEVIAEQDMGKVGQALNILLTGNADGE